jgi:hypothetical protein
VARRELRSQEAAPADQHREGAVETGRNAPKLEGGRMGAQPRRTMRRSTRGLCDAGLEDRHPLLENREKWGTRRSWTGMIRVREGRKGNVFRATQIHDG